MRSSGAGAGTSWSVDLPYLLAAAPHGKAAVLLTLGGHLCTYKGCGIGTWGYARFPAMKRGLAFRFCPGPSALIPCLSSPHPCRYCFQRELALRLHPAGDARRPVPLLADSRPPAEQGADVQALDTAELEVRCTLHRSFLHASRQSDKSTIVALVNPSRLLPPPAVLPSNWRPIAAPMCGCYCGPSTPGPPLVRLMLHAQRFAIPLRLTLQSHYVLTSYSHLRTCCWRTLALPWSLRSAPTGPAEIWCTTTPPGADQSTFSKHQASGRTLAAPTLLRHRADTVALPFLRVPYTHDPIQASVLVFHV